MSDTVEFHINADEEPDAETVQVLGEVARQVKNRFRRGVSDMRIDSLESHNARTRALNEKIKQHIDGRKMGDELFGLIEGDTASRPYMEALIASLKLRSGLEQPPTESREPPPVPIARLGGTELPFGLHKGKAFDDVPLDYLDWLCREQETFYKELRAYLKHPDLESRRRGLGPDRTA